MEQEQEEVLDNSGKDIAHSWVSSSRFLFYCQLIIIAALILGSDVPRVAEV